MTQPGRSADRMEQVRASVVICAYSEERWADLLATVRSVQAQTHPPFEIILVIDHHPTLLARAMAALSECRVIANTSARGLAGGRNTGVASAQGDVVAFLDDDVVAEPEWLARLLTGYADPDVVGVGGQIMPAWDVARPGWFPPEFDWVVGCTYRGLPTATAQVRNLIGANMSIRRSVLIEHGGFRLGYGCDETDFCIHVQRRQRSARFLYQPDSIVHHRVPAMRSTLRYFVRRCFFEGESKAVVSWLAGPSKGLASERAYVATTLPRGVWNSVVDGVRSRRLDGLARALAIGLGLAATGSGYLWGLLTVRQAARRRGWGGASVAVSSAAGRSR